MSESLTDLLCTRCGLCCDGTLMADVELAGRAEASRIEAMGLEIDDDSEAPLMVLPCRALQGTRCGVYAHRPRCCKSFECRLLDDARRGLVSIDGAVERIEDTLARVAEVKVLLVGLGQPDRRLPLKERCAEALSTDARAHPAHEATRERLARSMSELDDVIRTTFLADPPA